MTELWHDFPGPNAGYVLELYERYRQNPESVDASARALFSHWTPSLDGEKLAEAVDAVAAVGFDKVVAAANLAQAIREYGHLAAQLDPLGSPPPGDPSLNSETYGLTDDDLRQMPASLVGGPIAAITDNAYEAIQELRQVYSSTIGYDFDHIRMPAERQWLRDAAECRRYRPSIDDPDFAKSMLDRLTQVE